MILRAAKTHSRPRHYSKYILVAAGDSLKSLAQKAYANSSLWYVLAAANALSGDADLVAGTQLKVPGVDVSKNDATTFKPYNPNEIIGSTAPGLPYIPPQPKSGCSALATIIRVVVAVVLAYVAPQIGYAMLIAGAGETVAQTVEIKQGYREQYNVGAIVVAVASAAIPNGGTTAWGKIGIAAMRAAGNYATSYLVNMALGIQDSFSWRGVATAAVTAAVSQAAFGNLPTETAAAQSATGSMVSATAPFSWSRVAQAAVVAVKEAGKSIVRSGIGYAVDKAILGEAHWNWGQVLSSAAVQAGSAFGGAYRQSGIAYNELKAQGLSEQDARLMAWGEKVHSEPKTINDLKTPKDWAAYMAEFAPDIIESSPLTAANVSNNVMSDIAILGGQTGVVSKAQRVQLAIEGGAIDVLNSYVKAGNREGYYQYIAAKFGDDYAALALGVVRNDSLSGQIANKYAADSAYEQGVRMTERDWDKFGDRLMALDWAQRQDYIEKGKLAYAASLPVKNVYDIHNAAFGDFDLSIDTWTPALILKPYIMKNDLHNAEKMWSVLKHDSLWVQGGGSLAYAAGKLFKNTPSVKELAWMSKMALYTSQYSDSKAYKNTNLVDGYNYYKGSWFKQEASGGIIPFNETSFANSTLTRTLNATRQFRIENLNHIKHPLDNTRYVPSK